VDTLNSVNRPGAGAHLRLDRAYLEKQIPITDRIAPPSHCQEGTRTLPTLLTQISSGPSAPRVARALALDANGTRPRSEPSIALPDRASCNAQRGIDLGISADFFCQEAVVICPMGDPCWVPLATSLAQLEGSSMSDRGRSATRPWNGF
jgi:hypothetical protein